MHKFKIYTLDEYEDRDTGYSIDALHEFGAAQALLSGAEHFGMGTLEARLPDGTVAARVNVEVFEVLP